MNYKKVPTKVLPLGIFMVILSEVLAFLVFDPREIFQFKNLTILLVNIGRILGISGFILFSWTLFLNTRTKTVQKLFGGLNECYRYHHLFGKWSFIVILFHPTVLFLNYLTISLNDALIFILSPYPIPVLLGKTAISIMVVILHLTFFVKLPYELWKNIHRFIGIAFILASIHMLKVGSSISYNDPLRFYMTLWIMLGVGSYFYKTIAGKYLIKRYKYEISKIVKREDILDIFMKPLGEVMLFSPGQYFFTTFMSTNGITRESHPYSFASDPQTNDVRVIIKTEGDYNIKLSNLQNGDIALLEGPYGNFGERLADNPQIWIAGGIGITPFLSMLSQVRKTKVYLFYSVDNKKSAVGLSEFRSAQNKSNKFKFILWETSIKGRISISKIIDIVGEDVRKAEIFICGPRGMVKSLVDQSMDIGVTKSKIHFDEFNLRY